LDRGELIILPGGPGPPHGNVGFGKGGGGGGPNPLGGGGKGGEKCKKKTPSDTAKALSQNTGRGGGHTTGGPPGPPKKPGGLPGEDFLPRGQHLGFFFCLGRLFFFFLMGGGEGELSAPDEPGFPRGGRGRVQFSVLPRAQKKMRGGGLGFRGGEIRVSRTRQRGLGLGPRGGGAGNPFCAADLLSRGNLFSSFPFLLPGLGGVS